MNSYLMLEVARQRTAERREAAQQAGRRRALLKAARTQRGAVAADAIDLPPVPDYVDGTFRTAEDVTERAGAAG